MTSLANVFNVGVFDYRKGNAVLCDATMWLPRLEVKLGTYRDAKLLWLARLQEHIHVILVSNSVGIDT